MGLFDWFSRCYYINLDQRRDRRRHIEKQLLKYDIAATRFEGIIGAGYSGCRKAHVGVLELARNEKSVVILEDDLILNSDIVSVMPAITTFLSDIDWDVFFFYMSNRTKLTESYKLTDKYSIHKINTKEGSIVGGHCYCVNGKAIDRIIEYQKKYESSLALDKIISRMDINKFCISPLLAAQGGIRKDRSNTTGSKNRRKWVSQMDWSDRTSWVRKH